MILNPLWLWNTLYLHHTFSLPKKSHKCYLLNISQGFFCWYVFLISTCILCWILAVSTQYYPSSPELLLCHQLLETKRLHFPDSHASRVLILTPPIRGIPARCGRSGRNRSHYCSTDIGRQVSFLSRCSQEVLQWLPYFPLWIIHISASGSSLVVGWGLESYFYN